MTSTPHRTHRPGPGAAPSRRRSSLLSLMAGLGLPLALSMSMSLSGGPAQAAAGGDATGFPAKPVRLLVGYPPGGVADIMARAIVRGVEIFKEGTARYFEFFRVEAG